MIEKALILDEKGIDRAVKRIAHEIIERNKGTKDVCLVGVLSRGAPLADRIARHILSFEGQQVPVGVLNIEQYRDDGKKTGAGETSIPFSVEGKRVVLVDDVLFTGRSVRAAIEAIIDRGRPKKIELAVLIDRGHRELPIRPDFTGKNLPTSKEEIVKVFLNETDKQEKVVILSKG